MTAAASLQHVAPLLGLLETPDARKPPQRLLFFDFNRSGLTTGFGWHFPGPSFSVCRMSISWLAGSSNTSQKVFCLRLTSNHHAEREWSAQYVRFFFFRTSDQAHLAYLPHLGLWLAAVQGLFWVSYIITFKLFTNHGSRGGRHPSP